MIVVWCLLCFISLQGLADACSCIPSSNLEKACNADFLFKAKVLTDLINPNNRQDFDDFYRIRRPRPRFTYKFESKSVLSRRQLRRLYTGSNSAMCGVAGLTPNQWYLFSGMVDQQQGRMTINLCGSWIEPLPLSKSSRRTLRHFKTDTWTEKCMNISSPIHVVNSI